MKNPGKQVDQRSVHSAARSEIDLSKWTSQILLKVWRPRGSPADSCKFPHLFKALHVFSWNSNFTKESDNAQPYQIVTPVCFLVHNYVKQNPKITQSQRPFLPTASQNYLAYGQRTRKDYSHKIVLSERLNKRTLHLRFREDSLSWPRQIPRNWIHFGSPRHLGLVTRCFTYRTWYQNLFRCCLCFQTFSGLRSILFSCNPISCSQFNCHISSDVQILFCISVLTQWGLCRWGCHTDLPPPHTHTHTHVNWTDKKGQFGSLSCFDCSLVEKPHLSEKIAEELEGLCGMGHEQQNFLACVVDVFFGWCENWKKGKSQASLAPLTAPDWSSGRTGLESWHSSTFPEIFLSCRRTREAVQKVACAVTIRRRAQKKRIRGSSSLIGRYDHCLSFANGNRHCVFWMAGASKSLVALALFRGFTWQLSSHIPTAPHQPPPPR